MKILCSKLVPVLVRNIIVLHQLIQYKQFIDWSEFILAFCHDVLSLSTNCKSINIILGEGVWEMF